MNLKDTFRYLGYGSSQADEQTLKLAEECWEELERTAVKRSCFREYPLSFPEDGRMDLGCFQVASRALFKNLEHCQAVVLFAATLGTGPDILIRKYSRLQMSRAVVMQAAAAAMLEDYCDRINEEIRENYEKQGYYLRPRFSPGYGDFPLDCQPALLAGLDAGKRIGITLTDSLLMAPSKSVTAVMGVASVRSDCIIEGCESCGRADCRYRRDRV